MDVRHDTLKQDVCRRFPLLAGSRVTLEADLNRRDWLQTLKCVVCRRFPLLVGSRVTLEADLNGRDWLQTLQAAGFDPQVRIPQNYQSGLCASPTCCHHG